MTVNEQLLTQLLNLLKDAKGFTYENAPIIAKEVLQYALFNNVLCILAEGLLFVGAVLAFKKASKIRDSFDAAPLFGCSTILAVVSAIMLFEASSSIYKVTQTPHLYLMDWTSEKLTGKKAQ